MWFEPSNFPACMSSIMSEEAFNALPGQSQRLVTAQAEALARSPLKKSQDL